jgi:uncharacterized oxidoreductase
MNTNGNVVLITGGGSGIGLALAEQLVHQGNQVIICGRRRQRLRAAQERLPQLAIRVCDVSKPQARQELAAWVTAEFGGLNLLINNAGIQRRVDFLAGDRDLQEADQEVATNLVAPIHLCALLIPHLALQAQAAIVNISSGLGFTPLAAVPVYCATKAAIHSLSLTLRYQLRDTSVRVFEVVPPMVLTNLSGDRRRPEGDQHAMLPEDVARGVLEALAQDRYEIALGPAMGLYTQRDALFNTINR